MNDATSLEDFAERYAKAWCSQDPEKVAAFYAKNGSISVNGAPPVRIVEVARGFTRDFPDMVVKFDRLRNTPTGTEFHWTFTVTNTGPGGTGKKSESAATNFGRSTTKDLLRNQKAISTPLTTNANSENVAPVKSTPRLVLSSFEEERRLM